MLELLILAAAAAVLITLSLRANARLRQHDRLPMQWSVTGSVNWTAPRRVALAFVPGLAIIVIAAVAASVRWLDPRPGQEGLEIPVLLIVAGGFIGVQWLHLRLIERSFRRG